MLIIISVNLVAKFVQDHMQIYLDHSSTTPPRFEVVSLLSQVLSKYYGNPSSLHSWGKNTTTIVEKARCQLANLINAPNPDSILFTSGGTESNNLAIFGIADKYKKPGHLIISNVEHSAISQPAKTLILERGWDVTFLEVDHLGRVNCADLQAAIREDTALISIIYGQSEVGTIEPIDQLLEIAHQHNILLHSDAVQVAGRIPLDVQKIPVDLLSLSSHKLYGPQGIGALYIKEGVTLKPQLYGGPQEAGRRAGTESVALIASFGLAAQLAQEDLVQETKRLQKLRDHLFELLAECPYLEPTGDLDLRLPHHLSFIINSPIDSFNSRTIVRQMDYAGIAISAGSACNSGKLMPSNVLLAMGYSPKQALCGLRLTLGRQTTLEDIEWTAMVLQQVLERLFAKV